MQVCGSCKHLVPLRCFFVLLIIIKIVLQNQTYKIKTNTVNSPGSTKQKPYLCEKYNLLAISHGVATVRASCGNVNISISSSVIFSQISSKYIGPLLLKVGINYFILPKFYVYCLHSRKERKERLHLLSVTKL